MNIVFFNEVTLPSGTSRGDSVEVQVLSGAPETVPDFYLPGLFFSIFVRSVFSFFFPSC